MGSPTKPAKITGALALLAAAFVWGMAFPAQTAASEVVGHFTFIAAKSSVACLFMLLLIGLRRVTSRRRRSVRGATGEVDPALSTQSEQDAKTHSGRKPKALGDGEPEGRAVQGGASRSGRLRAFLAKHRRVLIGGAVCGLVLFVADNCQQAGISSYPAEAAASGRAGFLTATYVVIVALLARFMGRRLHPAVVVAVFVCLAGMYLLCVPLETGFSGVYVGDVIMLAGALFYALHIVAVGRFALEDALWLSGAQFFTSALLSAICAGALEGATLLDVVPALLPVLYVGVFSTGLGYTLQNIGQRSVDEAPAAILMSLESVFAALGGWVLLSERLSGTELLGCALVFAAVLLAQLPSFKKRRS